MRPSRTSPRWRRVLGSATVALVVAGGLGALATSPAQAATGALTGAGSGRCVDVPNVSQTNGTAVVLWDCNGGTNQRWTTTAANQLQVYGNKCLTTAVQGGYTRAVIGSCSGNAGQKWNVNSNGTVTNVASGLCLDAAAKGTVNNTAVIVWTCHGGTNQKWSLAGGTTPPPVTNPPATTRPPTTQPPAPAGNTPVARHGQLHVCGTSMCDRNNAKIQLRGISSMWLNWEDTGYAENLSALTWMRDNWHLSVFRAAMGVEPDGAYLSNPTKARQQVETVINNAVKAGVYVIVDFHAHEAYKEQAQAVAFFSDLSRRYGNLPNVIWEPWNEPLQISWTDVLKPYHQAVTRAIRANDPDNIIVLGTPTWSQSVDVAAQSPVAGTNLMYTLHFYSCTHQQSLRNYADIALRAGLPIFVTEWGASDASGGTDGRVCLDQAQLWIDWMNKNNISWAAWKLDDCSQDSTCLLNPGAPVNGNWNAWLHGHASFVRDKMVTSRV